MIKVDKSVFSAEELAQYEALIAKATVDTEAAEDEMEKEKPIEPKTEDTNSAEGEATEETKKSAVNPEMTAAIERMEKLAKSIEMKEFAEIAKKYAPLGENEEELAKTLYDMKKSNEDNYNAYIGILDKSLGLVEKSGIFSEIGKSASGTSSASDATAKAEQKANELMKSDPNMDYTTAIAKAWEDPTLMAEYDAEYQR